MRIRKRTVAACLLTSAVAVTGCSKLKKAKSGTDDSNNEQTTEQNKSAKNVDDAVVTAPTGSLKLAGALNLLVSDDGATLRLADGGDFATDPTNFWTDDHSLEALNTVQTIMCFMEKTGYSDEHVVNKGKIIAQVDMANCEKNGGGGGGGGQGGQPEVKKVEMTQIIVDASREENKPLKSKMWFEMKDHDGGDSKERIAVSLAVAEGPSAANPIGIFRLVFLEGMVDKSGTFTPAGHGQLESKRDENGHVVLSFFENQDMKMGDDFEKSTSAVAVRLQTEGDKVVGGFANLKSDRNSKHDGHEDNQASDYKLAFNKKFFASHDNVKGENVCRDQNAYNMSVWRYGVYDAATSKRVQMKGGFSFTYDKGGSQGHGWASYYGLSTENGSIADGTVVTKDNFGDANAPKATYKVKTGKGKLQKVTRHAISLDELNGIEMQAWGMDGKTSRVVYDKATGKFMKNGEMQQSNNGPGEWNDVAPTEYALNEYGNSFYSDGLGGQVELAMDQATKKPTGAAFYSSEDVTGTSANLSLHCLQQCVKGNLTASMIQSNQANWVANEQNSWEPFTYANAKEYTFDAGTLMLSGEDGPIALASGESVPQGSWIPGLQGLVDDATFAKMQADGVQAYMAHNQDVTYSWNVGDPSNPWTMYMALVDDQGKAVTFDAPRFVTYTHKAENDITGQAASKSFGKTYHLQYDGSSLMVPGHQDKETGYWVNDFAIKAGVKSDDGALLFKPLEGTKYMKSVDAAQCADLDTTKVPDLPDASSFDQTKANNDAMPDASALPSVIVNGEYQAAQ